MLLSEDCEQEQKYLENRLFDRNKPCEIMSYLPKNIVAIFYKINDI
jgi:hypothetical protein